MNGELAQVICLASYGSSWLAHDGHSDPPALDRENSTFKFVGSLGFHLAAGSPGEEFHADTVTDWLRRLRDREVRRLWLVIPEAKPVTGLGHPVGEHMLAGFANAGRWGLAATGERQHEIWRASWAVGDRAAPEHRIWAVHYQGAYLDEVVPQRPDVRSAHEQLARALEAAHEFAARQHLDPWPAWFERALASSRDIPYHPDMLPPDYTSEAHQLAAMAARAWVFGGMGSWNDLGFEDKAVQAEYDEVSRNLYAAVLLAMLASVNQDLSSHH